MRAHEAGALHADIGHKAPPWLRAPRDPNDLVTALWSNTAKKNGPIQSASMRDPIAADPTHHHAAMPPTYPREVAPTVEPAPMLAASMVEKMSPGPSRRPATKKSDAPRTRRPIHRPNAISATEYAERMMT